MVSSMIREWTNEEKEIWRDLMDKESFSRESDEETRVINAFRLSFYERRTKDRMDKCISQ